MPPVKTPGKPGRRGFVQSREPATGDLNGEPFVLRSNEILSTEHPLVLAHPDLFKPVEPSRQRPEVEQMTAASGEKRGLPTEDFPGQ